jgi:hypothetical protein
LFSQDPQCEGYHRDRLLFDTTVRTNGDFRFYKGTDGTYILHAGLVRGVTKGAQFGIYENQKSALRAVLSVGEAGVFKSHLTVPTDASHLDLNEGIARQITAGTDPDLLLHVPRHDDYLVPIFEAVLRLMRSTGVEHSQISLVEKGLATLHVIPENEHLVLHILDRRVTKHGLTRIPHVLACNPDTVYSVLGAITRYYRHLNREPSVYPNKPSADEPTAGKLSLGAKKNVLREKVGIEFTKLEYFFDEFDFRLLARPCGDNIFMNGIIRLDADTGDVYGMKITNKTLLSLYVSVFYFDNSDFSIGEYFVSKSIWFLMHWMLSSIILSTWSSWAI